VTISRCSVNKSDIIKVRPYVQYKDSYHNRHSPIGVDQSLILVWAWYILRNSISKVAFPKVCGLHEIPWVDLDTGPGPTLNWTLVWVRIQPSVHPALSPFAECPQKKICWVKFLTYVLFEASPHGMVVI
jgi:hypothetical protein